MTSPRLYVCNPAYGKANFAWVVGDRRPLSIASLRYFVTRYPLAWVTV